MYLGNLGISTKYDSLKPEQGKKYKVIFNRPAGLTDRLVGIIYNGKNVLQRYMEYWNQSYSARFQINTSPVISSDGNTMSITGTGTASKETWSKLGLDRYWATGKPLWDKTGFLGAWERRGVEGVGYFSILDSSGRDIVAAKEAEQLIEEQKQQAEEQKIIEQAGGSGILGSSSGVPVVPIAIGAVLLVTAAGTIIALRRRSKVVTLTH